MPRKVFVAGEILTAADVNTNLADQVVMTFAGTAARGSAIGTAVEGMVTYLEDTDQLEVYGGTAVGWSSASNFLFGTATPSEGQVATFSTAVSGYVPADAPSGKVLQVVSTSGTAIFSTTSGTFQDTGFSATITPSSTSSQIFVIMAFNNGVTNAGDSLYFTVFRDSTNITPVTAYAQDDMARIFRGSASEGGLTTLHIVDSPSTTSAVEYSLYMRTDAVGGTGYVGRIAANTATTQPTIVTLMEIAG